MNADSLLFFHFFKTLSRAMLCSSTPLFSAEDRDSCAAQIKSPVNPVEDIAKLIRTTTAFIVACMNIFTAILWVI